MKPPEKKKTTSLLLDPFRAALTLLRSLALPQKSADLAEGAIRRRDVSTLAELGQFEDREYHDPDQLSALLGLRQIACLFKKNSAFADEDKCTAAAQKSFERGERICRITNKRLDYYSEHSERFPEDIRCQVTRMEQDIQYLLGDVDDVLGAMPSIVRLTNGATEDRSRLRSNPFLKITGRIRAPKAAVGVLGRLMLHFGIDLSLLKFTCVEWNTITLVPKSWKTHRTIAKEPTHSLPIQLALDAWLKTLLRRWRIDLSSQQLNQEMARLGSLDGSFATIDLEMASDTLSYNAVALLLPIPWLRLFEAVRSSTFRAPWGDGVYAKFSSMGNGYTFSLETLIFTAACRAVGSQQYTVYGDDIVIETDRAPSLIKLLHFLGFRVNDAKSFINPASRFRESCGADWYKGNLVTPFYLRECPKLVDKAGLSHVLNGLIATAVAPSPLWEWAISVIKREKLLLVPYNEDTRSGVFITPTAAWETKRLKVDRRHRVGKVPLSKALGPRTHWQNPNYGFPVFKGYMPIQDRRKTAGWRSLFLWFLMKGCEMGDVSTPVSNRMSVYLLQIDRQMRREAEGTATVTSYVSERCRYVHAARRYFPQPAATPSHLYQFSVLVVKAVAPL
jgi:hypothetical protein